MSIYNIHDWYWKKADGSLFASGRGLTVLATDATYVAWSAAGGVPTAWPADDAGQQTDAALQWVFDNAGVKISVASVPLASLQASLQSSIDAAAEVQRQLYITPGAGQAGTYIRKQAEAGTAIGDTAWIGSATPQQVAAKYPFLTAEVGVTVDPTTSAPATDILGVARSVNAAAALWYRIGAAIEGVRLRAKAAIGAATTADAAQAAFAAVQWPTPS